MTSHLFFLASLDIKNYNKKSKGDNMKLEILPTPIIEAEYDEQFFQNPIFKDFHECLNNNVKTGLDLLYQILKL